MALVGKGVLVTFTEVPSDIEQDYNEWYNREHLDERVNMPGFRRARRYIAVHGSPKYFASYETATVEDLRAPEYLARLADQTAWSKRIMARFSKFHRLTCRVSVDLTQGIGGAITVVRFFPAEDTRDRLRSWLADSALPEIIGRPGLLGACLWENVPEVANAPARAQGVDFPETGEEEWAVIVEGAEPEPVEAAARAVFGGGALKHRGVPAEPVFGTYRLLYGNSR